jgi:pilus assembly protein Flp/PilA
MNHDLSGSFGRLRTIDDACRRFRADQNGATAIEYALIAAAVGGTIAATIFLLGDELKATYYERISAAFK